MAPYRRTFLVALVMISLVATCHAQTFTIGDVTSGESDGTVDLTVELDVNPGGNPTIDYTTADDSAVDGDDYSVASGTLTFQGASTSETITVTILPDSLDEDAETFVVNLTNASDGSIGNDQATVTITDDDDAPTVSLSDETTGVEGASGASTDVTFTASLDAESGKTITMNFAASDGTATVTDGDYSSSDGSLTFSPGDTTKTFTGVTVSGDDKDEDDETYTVRLSDITNAQNLTASGTGTITDDDAEPTVSIGDATVAESDDGTTVDVVVSLSSESGKEITVDYTTGDDTAFTSDGDYTADGPTTLTFAAGETAKTVTLIIGGDTKDEADESFFVTLDAATNVTIAGASATVTISNDDSPPDITVNTSSAVDESTGTMTFTVSISNPSDSTVTFDYATADGSATASDDYTAVSPAVTLTWNAGESSDKTVGITLVDDDTYENDENFSFVLSNVTGGKSGSATINGTTTQSSTGTITNDDALPTLSIDDVTEDENLDGSFDFVVTASGAADQAITVTYGTQDDDATTGDSDYTSKNGTATIAAETTTTTITVDVTSDTKDEYDEAFRVILNADAQLADGTSLKITQDTGTGTITNDDTSPGATVSGSSVAEGDSGTTTVDFTVTLDAVSGKTVTVNYTTTETDGVAVSTDDDADGSLDGDSDFEAAASAVTFVAGDTSETVSITVNGDTVDEADETFKLELTTASEATIDTGSGTDTATGTITNDDSPPSFWIADSGETENTGSIVFTITASHTSQADITVGYSTTSGTAVDSSDFTEINDTTVVFPGGESSKTFTVTLSSDTTDEEDETFTVGLDSISGGASGSATLDGVTNTPANVSGSGSTATGTITNDDTPPAISIATSDGVDEVDENSAGTVEFTVTMSHESSVDITVDYADNEGTAVATGTAASGGADYNTAGGTLTILAGTLTATATAQVTVNGDTTDETDEAFSVILSNPGESASGTATFAADTATMTILNDDAAPTISLDADPAAVTEADGASITFGASLSNFSSADITVGYTTTNGTDVSADAQEGVDYTLTSGTVTFAKGEDTAAIVVPLLDDATDEDSQQFALQLTTGSGGANDTATVDTGADTATGTITDDDDAPPTVTIADSSATEPDTGATATLDFVVSLSVASDKTVTVTYATTAGDAADGVDTITGLTDFRAVDGDSISFDPGETQVDASVTITGDDTDEVDETFTATLSESDAEVGTLGSPSSATGTISDNDDSPTLSVSASGGTGSETSLSGASPTVTFTLSAKSAKEIQFDYTTVADTADDADADGDYDSASDTGQVIAAGVLELTDHVTLTVNDDDYFEDDETFSVAATATSGFEDTVTIADAATITIQNDDAEPAIVSISSSDAGLYKAGGSPVITVTFNQSATLSSSDYTLDLNSGGSASTSTVSDASSVELTYTVLDGENTGGLDVTSVTGVLKNKAGFDFSLDLPDDTILPDTTIMVDTDKPVASLSITTVDEGITPEVGIANGTSDEAAAENPGSTTSAFVLTVSLTDANSTGNLAIEWQFDVEESAKDTTAWDTLDEQTGSGSFGSYTYADYVWTAPVSYHDLLYDDASIPVRVRATDDAGNVGEASDTVFLTVSNVAPVAEVGLPDAEVSCKASITFALARYLVPGGPSDSTDVYIYDPSPTETITVLADFDTDGDGSYGGLADDASQTITLGGASEPFTTDPVSTDTVALSLTRDQTHKLLLTIEDGDGGSAQIEITVARDDGVPFIDGWLTGPSIPETWEPGGSTAHSGDIVMPLTTMMSGISVVMCVATEDEFDVYLTLDMGDGQGAVTAQLTEWSTTSIVDGDGLQQTFTIGSSLFEGTYARDGDATYTVAATAQAKESGTDTDAGTAGSADALFTIENVAPIVTTTPDSGVAREESASSVESLSVQVLDVALDLDDITVDIGLSPSTPYAKYKSSGTALPDTPAGVSVVAGTMDFEDSDTVSHETREFTADLLFEDGPYTGDLTIKVTDDVPADAVTQALSVNIKDVSPAFKDANGDDPPETEALPGPYVEGEAFTVSGVFVDPGIHDTHTISLSGFGTIEDGPDFTGEGSETRSYTAEVSVADGTADGTLSFLVSDAEQDGATDTLVYTATVDNVPPQDAAVTAAGGATGDGVPEGSKVTFTPSATDVDPDLPLTFEYTVVSPDDRLDVSVEGDEALFPNDGLYAVSVVGVDKDGDASDPSDTVTVRINNVPPEPDPVSFTGSVDGAAVGDGSDTFTTRTDLEISFTFQDVGLNDEHIATVDWEGDGGTFTVPTSASRVGGVDLLQGTVQHSRSIPYTTPGGYDPQVTLDDGGDPVVVAGHLEIKDPAHLIVEFPRKGDRKVNARVEDTFELRIDLENLGTITAADPTRSLLDESISDFDVQDVTVTIVNSNARRGENFRDRTVTTAELSGVPVVPVRAGTPSTVILSIPIDPGSDVNRPLVVGTSFDVVVEVTGKDALDGIEQTAAATITGVNLAFGNFHGMGQYAPVAVHDLLDTGDDDTSLLSVATWVWNETDTSLFEVEANVETVEGTGDIGARPATGYIGPPFGQPADETGGWQAESPGSRRIQELLASTPLAVGYDPAAEVDAGLLVRIEPFTRTRYADDPSDPTRIVYQDPDIGSWFEASLGSGQLAKVEWAYGLGDRTSLPAAEAEHTLQFYGHAGEVADFLLFESDEATLAVALAAEPAPALLDQNRDPIPAPALVLRTPTGTVIEVEARAQNTQQLGLRSAALDNVRLRLDLDDIDGLTLEPGSPEEQVVHTGELLSGQESSGSAVWSIRVEGSFLQDGQEARSEDLPIRIVATQSPGPAGDRTFAPSRPIRVHADHGLLEVDLFITQGDTPNETERAGVVTTTSGDPVTFHAVLRNQSTNDFYPRSAELTIGETTLSLFSDVLGKAVPGGGADVPTSVVRTLSLDPGDYDDIELAIVYDAGVGSDPRDGEAFPSVSAFALDSGSRQTLRAQNAPQPRITASLDPDSVAVGLHPTVTLSYTATNSEDSATLRTVRLAISLDDETLESTLVPLDSAGEPVSWGTLNSVVVPSIPGGGTRSESVTFEVHDLPEGRDSAEAAFALTLSARDANDPDTDDVAPATAAPKLDIQRPPKLILESDIWAFLVREGGDPSSPADRIPLSGTGDLLSAPGGARVVFAPAVVNVGGAQAESAIVTVQRADESLETLTPDDVPIAQREVFVGVLWETPTLAENDDPVRIPVELFVSANFAGEALGADLLPVVAHRTTEIEVRATGATAEPVELVLGSGESQQILSGQGPHTVYLQDPAVVANVEVRSTITNTGDALSFVLPASWDLTVEPADGTVPITPVGDPPNIPAGQAGAPSTTVRSWRIDLSAATGSSYTFTSAAAPVDATGKPFPMQGSIAIELLPAVDVQVDPAGVVWTRVDDAVTDPINADPIHLTAGVGANRGQEADVLVPLTVTGAPLDGLDSLGLRATFPNGSGLHADEPTLQADGTSFVVRVRAEEWTGSAHPLTLTPLWQVSGAADSGDPSPTTQGVLADTAMDFSETTVVWWNNATPPAPVPATAGGDITVVPGNALTLVVTPDVTETSEAPAENITVTLPEMPLGLEVLSGPDPADTVPAGTAVSWQLIVDPAATLGDRFPAGDGEFLAVGLAADSLNRTERITALPAVDATVADELAIPGVVIGEGPELVIVEPIRVFLDGSLVTQAALYTVQAGDHFRVEVDVQNVGGAAATNVTLTELAGPFNEVPRMPGNPSIVTDRGVDADPPVTLQQNDVRTFTVVLLAQPEATAIGGETVAIEGTGVSAAGDEDLSTSSSDDPPVPAATIGVRVNVVTVVVDNLQVDSPAVEFDPGQPGETVTVTAKVTKTPTTSGTPDAEIVDVWLEVDGQRRDAVFTTSDSSTLTNNAASAVYTGAWQPDAVADGDNTDSRGLVVNATFTVAGGSEQAAEPTTSEAVDVVTPADVAVTVNPSSVEVFRDEPRDVTVTAENTGGETVVYDDVLSVQPDDNVDIGPVERRANGQIAEWVVTWRPQDNGDTIAATASFTRVLQGGPGSANGPASATVAVPRIVAPMTFSFEKNGEAVTLSNPVSLDDDDDDLQLVVQLQLDGSSVARSSALLLASLVATSPNFTFDASPNLTDAPDQDGVFTVRIGATVNADAFPDERAKDRPESGASQAQNVVEPEPITITYSLKSTDATNAYAAETLPPDTVNFQVDAHRPRLTKSARVRDTGEVELFFTEAVRISEEGKFWEEGRGPAGAVVSRRPTNLSYSGGDVEDVDATLTVNVAFTPEDELGLRDGKRWLRLIEHGALEDPAGNHAAAADDNDDFVMMWEYVDVPPDLVDIPDPSDTGAVRKKRDAPFLLSFSLSDERGASVGSPATYVYSLDVGTGALPLKIDTDIKVTLIDTLSPPAAPARAPRAPQQSPIEGAPKREKVLRIELKDAARFGDSGTLTVTFADPEGRLYADQPYAVPYDIVKLDVPLFLYTYPNPVAPGDPITVRVLLEDQTTAVAADYKLFDVSGRLVDVGSLNAPNVTESTRLWVPSELPGGVYIMRVTVDAGANSLTGDWMIGVNNK